MRLIIFMCTGLAMAQSSDLVLPWVTNNAQFRSEIAINNLAAEAVMVDITATRVNGETTTVSRTLEAYEQLVESAADLFPELGEGGGFAVFISSDGGMLTAGYVVSGTQSASGSSPAQANAVTPESGNNFIIYNLLTNPTDGGASAPVAVNLGSEASDVTFHAFQEGQKLGEFVINVPPKTPYANVTSAMFPGVEGNVYVVAESNNPIVGAAFIFNSQLEPSMANAGNVSGVPDPQPPAGVSFVNDIQPIFSGSCAFSNCHQGSNPASGLDLSAGNAFAQIVGVSAVQSSLNRVEPGSADQSYLYKKLLGTDISGSRMPRNMPPLSQENIDLVRDWINQGANNN